MEFKKLMDQLKLQLAHDQRLLRETGVKSDLIKRLEGMVK